MAVRRKKKISFKAGDRVVRNKAIGAPAPSNACRGDVAGTVLKVTPMKHGSGGTSACARVRWDNGHEAAVEDRQIVRIARDAEAPSCAN